MKKRLGRAALVLGLLGAVGAASAIAVPTTFHEGNLFLTDNGGITPTALPRHKAVPIAGSFVDTIGTLDGTHPPAFKSLIADFDKTILIDVRGLPTCKKGQLEARDVADARAACPDAIVGTGHGEVDVEFPEQAPFSASSPITLFNGGAHGNTITVYVHAYINVPTPTALVIPAQVTRENDGHYGLHVVAKLPPIAGGAGSPTNFRFTIHRNFTRDGKAASFLSASCPTGHYFAQGKVQFGDGTLLMVSHDLPCTPKG